MMARRKKGAAPVEEFCRIVRGAHAVLAREDCAETVAEALVDGKGCTPFEGGGRGALCRFAIPGGHGIIRVYRRGGVVRHFLRESYVLANRPLREFRVHRYVEQEGLPVPPLLGVCWRRKGALLGGAIATEEVPALDLGTHVAECAGPHDDLMRACGALVRQMHALGVWHADLQVGNILVAPSEPLLLDFDNAQRKTALSLRSRARNLLRFRRSLEKNGLELGLFEPFCVGYGVDSLPGWLQRAYRAKGKLSDLASGKDA